MSCNSIKDPVDGYGAKVASDGSLHTKITSLPEPVETEVTSLPTPVETSPFESSSVTTTTTNASTTSAELVGSNASRRQIDIQNLDSTNAVHLLFANSGTATTSHFRLGPGERYSFPPGVVWVGAIRFVASAGTPAVVLNEFDA